MKKIMDGNKACASIAYKFSDIAGIYPITPSSPMASEYEKQKNKKVKNIFGDIPEIVEMQSEAGAAGFVHGSLLSGALATSFTSSQGLLLMIPAMYKIAGEELPCVLHVASRTLATHALSIFGDHQDVYATRDTGFCILASGSVQEAYDLAAVAHLTSIATSMPFVHFFDGFRTSHELNVVNEIDDKYFKKLINKKSLKEFRDRSMNIDNQITHGTNQNADIYFQSVEARNNDYDEVINVISGYFEEINKVQGTNYRAFNYYGSKDAKNIIIAMGSTSKTIINVVNDLVKKGVKIGFVEVHLYRPFSSKLLNEIVPKTVQKIVVLDRAKMPGSTEALYQDVCSCIKNKTIIGGRYGLSGKNVTPSDIVSIYNAMEKGIQDSFTVGIDDDVTHKSLKNVKYNLSDTCEEVVIYGYGSDGMISASKDLLSVYHNETNNYVQGFFEYDSKKSGGVTVSNLRFSKNKIEMPYTPLHPSIIVVTKEEYLNKFHLTKTINKNGIIIVNSDKNFDELNVLDENIEDLKEKNITIFTIDADKISSKYGINGKNGNIFSAILLKLLGVDNYIEVLSEYVTKRYLNLGKNIVNANIKCIINATNYLVEHKGTLKQGSTFNEKANIYSMIPRMEGNSLKVSDLLEYRTGEFKVGKSYLEKCHKTGLAPSWIGENCISCMKCVIMCPHAAIKPYILEKDNNITDKGIDLLGDKLNKYKLVIDVSKNDCTSCGVCESVCTGKNEKALKMVDKNNLESIKGLENYKNPKVLNENSLISISTLPCGFEYSAACAGCGQTPYLKLLSSMFKEKIMIVNATGCSSIYGGSVPFTPYSIPWVNPLFENNAEVALGMHKSFKTLRGKVKKLLIRNMDSYDEVLKDVAGNYIKNIDDFETSKISYKEFLENDIKGIKSVKQFVKVPTIWAVGGDGWAYDIGFSGIDHVLSSGENVKILILDTECYSNTGGQASKASQIGQVCKFEENGKKTHKKDLFRFAMNYDNVYVAQTCIGANAAHTIKVFKEADAHTGPSIIICYAPCIEHNISGGMKNMVLEEMLAVESGYFMLMRYKDNKLYIDSKAPKEEALNKFFANEARYYGLKNKDAEEYKILLNKNKKEKLERYKYYEKLKKMLDE